MAEMKWVRETSNEALVERAKKILAETPDGERFSWNFKQHSFANHIVECNGLDNFLEWSPSAESLYAGYTRSAELERGDIPVAYRGLGIDPPIGKPPGPKSPEGSSGTYIRQLYVAHQIVSNIGLLEDMSRIVEFGGGYGALALTMYRMGFNGKYAVYDLPVMHLIRDWYLGQLGLEVLSLTEEDLEHIINTTLFVSVCAIDEASIETRERFLKKIFAKHYFLVFHKNWDGVNNSEWFADWLAREGIAPKIAESHYKDQMIMYGSRK